jgi:hypothetical protein
VLCATPRKRAAWPSVSHSLSSRCAILGNLAKSSAFYTIGVQGRSVFVRVTVKSG